MRWPTATSPCPRIAARCPIVTASCWRSARRSNPCGRVRPNSSSLPNSACNWPGCSACRRRRLKKRWRARRAANSACAARSPRSRPSRLPPWAFPACICAANSAATTPRARWLRTWWASPISTISARKVSSAPIRTGWPGGRAGGRSCATVAATPSATWRRSRLRSRAAIWRWHSTSRSSIWRIANWRRRSRRTRPRAAAWWCSTPRPARSSRSPTSLSSTPTTAEITSRGRCATVR